MSRLTAPYLPHRPTETVLYRLVRRHLETFLEHARETYDAPLPEYVEQELRAYLRCGVFAHGFVHARCENCGHDLLVAFSCKGRGACPSCAGRRMANTAAHLVDRVLPAVPVRQWVLSLPFELRAIAAYRAEVLTALSRIFVESVFKRYRADARWLAASPRIDWATLLRRTFDIDVPQCPACRGRIRILADVTDPVFARAVLQALGVDSVAPVPARARDPTELLADVDAGD